MSTWTRHLYEHDPLTIAKGESKGYSFIHKFGANFDIDTASDPESVWTGGGLYPWSSLSTAQTIYCISTSSSDTGTLEIQGLDADYNVQTETVTLTGTTAVTTAKTFLRIYRMFYTHTSDNIGTLTARVTSGTGTVVAQIDEGYNQTLMAVYTIPAGYTGYFLCTDCTINALRDLMLMFYIRPPQGNFRIAHLAEVRGFYRYDFPIPLRITEKSDLDIRVDQVNFSNSRATANFDLILIDERLPSNA